MAEQPDPAELQAEAQAFRDRCRTVVLATADADGRPEASVTPYALDEAGHLLVFVSELARHTGNLLANPRASALFAADEADTRNPFARRRLVLGCRAEEIARDSTEGADALARLRARHGPTLDTLAALPDFHLFRLVVERGSYVRGFGNAWALRGPELAPEGLRRR